VSFFGDLAWPSDLIRREEMKRKAALLVFGLVLVSGGAIRSEAQVKRVQMHIAGYLCGN
jgi:hypothetical protein